jgi:outer membrane lipoprotein-sorting protein
MRPYLIFALICLLLASCAPRPRAPLPVTPGMEHALLDRVTEIGGAFGSLQGVARVKVELGGKSMASTQVLLAEKPDRLRAEVLSPFGQPVLLAASDGVEISLLVPSKSKFYRGAASEQNLRRVFRVPLRLTDLVHILLYQVPMGAYDSRKLTVNDQGEYVLTLSGPGERREELLFDSERHLVGANYFLGAEALLRVDYGKFTTGNPAFPESVSLQMPAQEASASVVFSDVKTNVTIPAERFQLTPPAGVKVEPIP